MSSATDRVAAGPRRHPRRRGEVRPYRSMAPALLALLLPACAWISGPFEPDRQQERLQRQQREARAEARAAEVELQSVEERLRTGDALRSDGAYARAMWSYLQAHELDPDDPRPAARMASLHLVVDPERAETIFRELAEKHPESGAAYTGLGLVRIQRHDWVGAREVLEQAIELSPSSAAAQSALGVSLDRLDEPEAAQQAYTRAIRLRPDFYEALNNLGVSYLAAGDFEASAEVLRRASVLESRDPAVFNNLGLALGRLKRYDAALEMFRRAGNEQPARNNLGYVAYLNGDIERAIAEYERALLADGSDRLLVLRNLRVAERARSHGGDGDTRGR